MSATRVFGSRANADVYNHQRPNFDVHHVELHQRSILSGGTLTINGDATVTDTAISGGGVLTVSAGAQEINGFLLSGASRPTRTEASPTELISGAAVSLKLCPGGSFANLVLESGGIFAVGSGVFITDFGSFVSFADGGIVTVLASGVTNALTFSNGSQEIVSNGGEADGTTIGAGGVLEAFGGAIVTNATIGAGGILDIGAGYTLDNTNSNAGGVFALDTAALINIESGGRLLLRTGDDPSTVTTTILGGGIVEVSGTTLDISDLSFNAGAIIEVDNTGITTGLSLIFGMHEIVSAGGEADSTTVFNNAKLTLSAGSALSAVINSGGTFELIGAATFTDASVAAHGIVEVGSAFTLDAAATSPALASPTRHHQGRCRRHYDGSADLVGHAGNRLRGGIANGTTVGNGGVLILSAGSAHNAQVNPGGTATLLAGALYDVLDIRAGGTLDIGPGFTLLNFTGINFEHGAILQVENNGVASALTISSGSQEIVLFGGTDSASTIISGGLQLLEGGTASGTTVRNGGDSTSSRMRRI